MRELWLTIVHTSGARIYAMALGVFTLFLTARLLGPEGRGEVAAINTWASLFSTFAYLSLGQVALNRMAADRERKRFGSLLGSLLLLTAILTIVGWLVAFGMHALNPQGAFKGLPLFPLAVGLLGLPVLIWEQYGSSLLIGLEKVRIYNRYQMIGRTAAVACVFLLVGGVGLGVVGVVGANLLGQVIVALGGLGFLLSFARRNGTKCQPDKHEIRELLSGGAKLHLNAIGTYLFTSANVLILNHYHGAGQTGHFQLANQLIGIMIIIPQAASMVIYGKVASIGPNEAWPINRRLLLQVTAVMTILGVVAAILAPWAITLMAGLRFRPAVLPFQWMLLGLIGMTFSTMMAPQWIGRGYLWQAAILSLVVGVINLLANFALIPRYGMKGAVIAFIGTYAVSVVGNGIMALRCESQFRHPKSREIAL